MEWITAEELNLWARSLGAREKISEIVARLIIGTAHSIDSIRISTGSSSQIHGFDGTLTASGVPPYVPEGDSIWEFGASEDYVQKADDDYEKRTKANKNSQTTLVIVTPRRWDRPRGPNLEEWEQQKKNENLWKDVRVYDGIKLEAWLKENPAVASYVSRYVLRKTPRIGARSTDEFWEEYSAHFDPLLTEQVLICDREDQAKDLCQRLGSGPSAIRLVADHPDEAVAFSVAAIRSATTELKEFLESRTLIIDSEEAARLLADRPNMIFIPRGNALSISSFLSTKNPTIVPLGRQDRGRGGTLVLNRPSTTDFQKALESMALEPGSATQLARKCGRSVTILRRWIPRAYADPPEWMTGDLRNWIPALLAGSWNAASDKDKESLEILSNGSGYDAYEEILRRVLNISDPFVDFEGGIWKLRAPVDAFVNLGDQITRRDLENLSTVIKRVFSEPDPSFDDSSEEHPFMSGQRRFQHSDWLRDGLATTLLQIAALHEEAKMAVPDIKFQKFVNDLIGGLPGLNRDIRVMASLREQLPMLMEAAPDPLLDALDQLIEGEGDAIKTIFRKGGIFSSLSTHTYFLWALEVMAWDPDYLPRASRILSKLAKVDPGGETTNRPINTLRDIFLPWNPETNATLVQRLAALDLIIEQVPEIAWKLLIMLLPTPHVTAFYSSRPRFREAGASYRKIVTRDGIRKEYNEVTKRALGLAGTDPIRWIQIIHFMANFDPELRLKTYNQLGGVLLIVGNETRLVLWNALRDFVNRHRAFSGARWSLKEEELAKLDLIVEKIKPTDPVEAVAWLFNEHVPELPTRNVDDHLAAVDNARKEAVRKLREDMGDASLIALASRVSFPQLVAVATVADCANVNVVEGLVDDAIGRSEGLDLFVSTLSGVAVQKFGEDWKTRFKENVDTGRWTADQVVTLLLQWPDDPGTWDLVGFLGLEIEQEYWLKKTPWPLKGDSETLEMAARKYLDVGRAVDGLIALGNHSKDISFSVLFELLDGILKESGVRSFNPGQMLLYQLDKIFDHLAGRDDVSRGELAKREYAFLPWLSAPGLQRGYPLVLYRMMAEDPSLFVDVICDVFKPASGMDEEPTEEL